MKTTIDIPDNVLRDAMKFAKAETKREAVVTALTEFNRRQRMAGLARHFGTCRNLMTRSDLARLRRTD